MALWYTCPVCDGTGAIKIREGSGFILEGDGRCNSSGIVTDVRTDDPRPKLSPPYHEDLRTVV